MDVNKESGLKIEQAKILILNVVEKNQSLRPSEMIQFLVKSEESPNNIMSRNMLFRALKQLVDEGKLVKAQEEGGKASIYYPYGRSLSTIRKGGPTAFEELLIDECKKIIVEIVDSRALIYNPCIEDIVKSPSKGIIEMKDEIEKKMSYKITSVFILIYDWEKSRGVKVPRPWSKDVWDGALRSGPDFLSMPWLSASQMQILETKIKGMTAKQIRESEFDLRDQIKGTFRGPFHVEQKFPGIWKWLQFYTNAIDTISDYIKANEKRPRNGKG